MTTGPVSFETVYRQVFGNDFATWDSPVLQEALRNQREPFALDAMYVPLRLAQGPNANGPERGAILDAKSLPMTKKSLLVFGPPGSGKTTWARCTFRLLIRNPAALPFLLTVDDLAKSREELGERGVLRFLADEIGQRLGAAFPAQAWSLEAIFGAQSGPRPILLVDGWAEYGILGAEIRAQTHQLMKLFPRLLVVATCRSGTRPSHSELFAMRDLQPFDRPEIDELSQHFFGQLYGDGDRSTVALANLQQVFLRSAATRDLASTPRLLTALLVLHATQGLPERPHLLYDACLRLLLAHPLDPQKPQLGLDETLRVLAHWAHDLQVVGYSKKDRRVLGQNQNELPGGYPPEGIQAGKAAGLLYELEGLLRFTHLPFQEYLAARHLQTTAVASRFLQLAAERNWRETLRLWAALAEDEDPTQAASLISALLARQGLEPSCLASLLWAEGLGYDEQGGAVAQALVQVLETETFGTEIEVAQDLAASSDPRRRTLLELLDHTAESRGWLMWQRLAAFVRKVDPQWALAKPRRRIHRMFTQQIGGEALAWAEGAAAARVLAGGYPLWPLVPTPWALLQLWPNSRRVVGARLQHSQAATNSATTQALEAAWLTPLAPMAQGAALDLARELAREWAIDLDRDLARNLARDLARGFRDDLEQEALRDWARDWVRDWEIGLPPFWAIDQAQEVARPWARELAGEWAQDHGLAHEVDLYDLLTYERLSCGRSGARAVLASLLDLPDDPRWRLLRVACHLSCNPSDPADAFLATLEQEGPACDDPLWPALARFLARRASSGDRHLLQDALRHPEQRPEPLRSGLQFIARGDVLLEDGTVKNLDTYCAENGLPHLPLLEDLPEELDLGADWDDDL